MTANLPSEYLSIREIRRRLRGVYDASCHLRTKLPPDNLHNAILTVRDISRLVNMPHGWLEAHRLETPPESCGRGCLELKHCPKRPTCRNIQPYLQKLLSDFFRGWDAGTIVKARQGDQWLLVPRHAALAQMAATSRSAPQARAIQGKVELTDQGVRLKL